MRLNDPLITSFEFESTEYQIDMSFDNVLDVFDILTNEALRDLEKAALCLEFLIGKYDDVDVIELWNFVFDNFIEIKKDEVVQYDLKGNPVPVKEKDEKRVIDIEKDANYIYSSFMQAYDMDLIEQQGNLHWYKFQSLLNGLPDDTVMKKIMVIRSWEPKSGDSSEYKKTMFELQERFALEEDGEEVD